MVGRKTKNIWGTYKIQISGARDVTWLVEGFLVCTKPQVWSLVLHKQSMLAHTYYSILEVEAGRSEEQDHTHYIESLGLAWTTWDLVSKKMIIQILVHKFHWNPARHWCIIACGCSDLWGELSNCKRDCMAGKPLCYYYIILAIWDAAVLLRITLFS